MSFAILMLVGIAYVILYATSLPGSWFSFLPSAFFSSEGALRAGFAVGEQGVGLGLRLIYLPLFFLSIAICGRLNGEKKHFAMAASFIFLAWPLFGLLATLIYVAHALFGYAIFHGLPEGRHTRWIQLLFINLPVVALLATWGKIHSPAGWPLFFLLIAAQWLRWVLYYADRRDGLTPNRMPMGEYLSVFLSPALVPGYFFGFFLPQSYSDLKKSEVSAFDSRVFKEGINLLIASSLLGILPSAAEYLASAFSQAQGVPVYSDLRILLTDYGNGQSFSTFTVATSVVLEQMKFFGFLACVAHLRIGAWRVMGYDLPSACSFPFLAPNILEFWKRYNYYFAKFLFRLFYFPALTGPFRGWRPPAFRIFAAGTFALVAGNLVSHFPARALVAGSARALPEMAQSIPYYLFLSAWIAATMAWHLRLGKKAPGALASKVMGAFLTCVIFAAIQLLQRDAQGVNLAQRFSLLRIAFGL